jgi:AAA ATPase domain
MVPQARDGVVGGWLLERDFALDAILDALGDVAGGGSAVVLLVGAAGIGKTALVQAAVRAGREGGFQGRLGGWELDGVWFAIRAVGAGYRAAWRLRRRRRC